MVQIRVTPKTRNPFTIRALSISVVTWKWHFLNHAYGSTIKFQKSKFIGSGRSATADDLISSIESVERYVLVDLRGFPVMRFVPLDSKALLRLIRQGKLTVSGISPKRFDAWLTEVFDVTTVKIDLSIPNSQEKYV